MQLLAARQDEHRLNLAHGTISARILAPPRLFFVETPASTVVDLGCAYTMTVDHRNIDLSLSKRVPLRRNVKLNLRLEAYNLLNGMNWANPSTTIGASDFGRVLRQADAYFGRQLQYTMRVEF